MSREKSNKIYSYFFISLTVIVTLCFLILGVNGEWISPWFWVSQIIVSTIFLLEINRSMGTLASKRLLAFILICTMITFPLFTLNIIVANQSTAQGLSTPKEMDYFKNLLGTSYNYTQLIVWENQHLNFTYGNIERNTDPIKIYQYGEGRCGEFAILYAELCISQGYQCRIVDNVFNDHEFNEVLLTNGTWIRVDASLNSTSSRAVGYPMFFEQQKGWGAPILSLAFENSSVVDVTSTYNTSDIRLDSPIIVALLILIYVGSIFAIVRFLI